MLLYRVLCGVLDLVKPIRLDRSNGVVMRTVLRDEVLPLDMHEEAAVIPKPTASIPFLSMHVRRV